MSTAVPPPPVTWTLLDAAPDAMLVVARDGTVVFANAETERMFGWGRDELVGRPVDVLLPEQFRARHGAHVDGFFGRPNTRPMGLGLQLHALRKDGVEVPVEISLSRYASDGAEHVVAAVRDVRDRLRVERSRDLARTEAEAARSHIAALLDHVPDHVIALDREGRVEFSNRELGERSRRELLGARWLDLVPEAMRERLAQGLSRVLESGAASSFETSARSEVGDEIFASVVIAPIRRDGAVSGALVMSRDVTEARRTEAQLLASERMAAIGMLAAGVAHEINNPLVGVLVNLDVLSEELERLGPATSLAPDLLEALRDSREAANRIRDVARDMKLLARADIERLVDVDPSRVVQSAVRVAKSELGQRARLVEDYEDVPPVRADEGRLGQVVLNLVLNAIQAIPEVLGEPHEIRVRTRRDGPGHVVLEVADTGVGMSEATLQRLFQPFFSTKPAGVGMGLGLAISKRIVDALGGTIAVESQLGRGTVFRVRLPAAPPRAESHRPPPPQGQRPGRRARILVIDDEAAIGNVVRHVLAGEHDVVVELSAASALARLDGGASFDLVICDLMMPDVTGADLYEHLEKTRPDILPRFVLMTGGAFTDRAQSVLDRAGVRRFDKPFDAEQLRDLVADAID